MSSWPSLGPMEVIAYEPGVCNIGPAEIGRRRRTGHVGVVLSAVLLVALVILGAPHWTRLVLVLTAGVAASGYLQARLHFCAGFGSTGVYNFGALGQVERVADAASRARDRRKSLEIELAALAIGLAVGVSAALLPIS
jgi:hypothetical protein